MDFLELAKNRYSCRQFSNKIVGKENMMELSPKHFERLNLEETVFYNSFN